MKLVDHWLASLEDEYAGEDKDKFHKRLTGWRAVADVPVLLYAIFRELREARMDCAHKPSGR